MPCPVRSRLISDYETAIKKFSEAVTELQTKMGTTPKLEYERLYRAADEARLKAEQARVAVEQHTAAHHC